MNINGGNIKKAFNTIKALIGPFTYIAISLFVVVIILGVLLGLTATGGALAGLLPADVVTNLTTLLNSLIAAVFDFNSALIFAVALVVVVIVIIVFMGNDQD